jgi:microcystin-dependent protein
MSSFKFVPDVFLEEHELNRIQSFLSDSGYKKYILENTVSYGLIKNNADIPFSNGFVSRDVDSGSDKTIKINPIAAIDSSLQFITSPNVINQLIVPNDGNFYWVRCQYASTTIEVGTLSIAVDGTVVGTGTEFTKVLRGQPNFPTKIKLTNSAFNTLEYSVLEVTDDTHCILANPSAASGSAVFVSESNRQYAVVGTFTNGVAIPTLNKYPYQYDSCSVSLELETVLNTPPSFVSGQQFYLARVTVSGSDVIVQDMRRDFYETKGSELVIDMDRSANPLVGIESTVWQVKTTPSDSNIVNIGWGLRSTNWSINTSTNTLTIISGLGGKYKAVGQFNNGDFDGWRAYTANGQYSRIVSSVRVGGAVNLILDTLNVTDYSNDFGVTMITQEVHIVPNCEEIEIICQSEPTDNTPSVNRTFTFPINDAVGQCELEVYKKPSVSYNIQYRYKSFKEYGSYFVIPSDNINGYLTEVSFDDKGVLLPFTSQVRQTYTQDPTSGFITLQMSPWSYFNFTGVVFKGDLIGVNVISSLTSSVSYPLTVGTSKNYQFIGGSQSIASDTTFTLDTGATGVEGNQFVIHFDCSSLTLGGHFIYVKQGSTTLKTIDQSDVYAMLNQEKGIKFTCKYDGTNWIISQNYDIGTAFEVKMITPGTASTSFDLGGTNLGQIRGWYGWQIYTDMTGRMPVGTGAFTEASGTYTRADGTTGGEVQHKLVTAEIPSHTHVDSTGHTHNDGTGHDHQTLATLLDTVTGSNGVGDKVTTGDWPSNPPGAETSGSLSSRTSKDHVSLSTEHVALDNTGGDGYHENMSPWLSLYFVKRLY